jgi:quercetin dioxygenase-like cupin family protein
LTSPDPAQQQLAVCATIALKFTGGASPISRRPRATIELRGGTMENGKVVYTAGDAAKTSSPEPGAQRQTQLMLVLNQFEKNWKGARHSHPHHQIVYVVRGHIRFEAEGKSWDLCAGDSVAVDGGVEHQASAYEASEVLDLFTPYRADYA